MPRKTSRPTVATIARDLGISAATVSYALNGKPGVGASLRARVIEHAREVGWTPHSGAQALRRGHSGNIGLVMVRDPQERSREPFYAADRKSTRLNSSHVAISYAVFCLKKKNNTTIA